MYYGDVVFLQGDDYLEAEHEVEAREAALGDDAVTVDIWAEYLEQWDYGEPGELVSIEWIRRVSPVGYPVQSGNYLVSVDYRHGTAALWVLDMADRCPACGDVIEYCQGHGRIGDPDGAAILAAHDDEEHARCDPRACDGI